jgi:hypothetical protein
VACLTPKNGLLVWYCIQKIKFDWWKETSYDRSVDNVYTLFKSDFFLSPARCIYIFLEAPCAVLYTTRPANKMISEAFLDSIVHGQSSWY